MDVISERLIDLAESVFSKRVDEKLVGFRPFKDDAHKKSAEAHVRTGIAIEACTPGPDPDPRPTLFDIDFGFHLWLHAGNWYAIPWGERWIIDKIDFPDWMEDYSYWNNADPPENISEEAWSEREETWNEVCLKDSNDWDRHRLVYTVIEMSPRSSTTLVLLYSTVYAALCNKYGIDPTPFA